jgi:hypothetical protein
MQGLALAWCGTAGLVLPACRKAKIDDSALQELKPLRVEAAVDSCPLLS